MAERKQTDVARVKTARTHEQLSNLVKEVEARNGAPSQAFSRAVTAQARLIDAQAEQLAADQRVEVLNQAAEVVGQAPTRDAAIEALTAQGIEARPADDRFVMMQLRHGAEPLDSMGGEPMPPLGPDGRFVVDQAKSKKIVTYWGDRYVVVRENAGSKTPKATEG